MQSHPEDTAQWTQVNSAGDNILVVAARHQKLAEAWGVLRDVPQLADRVERFVLKEVWQWDWEALGGADQAYFSVEDYYMVPAREPTTGALWSRMQYQRLRDPAEMREWVSAGADVNFTYGPLDTGILAQIVERYDNEFLTAALETPRSIDFTLADADGNTPLHFLCTCLGGLHPHQDTEARKKMHAVAHRLRAHPEDVVDLMQVNYERETM